MYTFKPEIAYNNIRAHWFSWTSCNGIFDWNEKDGKTLPKVVIGISGGKDSTVVAGLFTKILGKDNVIGVSLPCDGQNDMSDVDRVFEHLGIKRITIDIGDAFHSIVNSIENCAIDVKYDTKTNLPARLRMSTLYAVAQSVGGIVLNTCNRTEDNLGYATLYGDSAGSYAPIQDLTVTEVIALGDWLGLPYELTHKTPIDGLQPLTDEEKLGMKYADVDMFIRLNQGESELKDKASKMYNKNKFKLDIIKIPGPKHGFPDYIRSESI